MHLERICTVLNCTATCTWRGLVLVGQDPSKCACQLHSKRLANRPCQMLQYDVPRYRVCGCALQGLWLHGNLLESLPEGLGALTALRTLSLSSNRLPRVPASLGTLTSLEELALAANRLSQLPPSLSCLGAVCCHRTSTAEHVLPSMLFALNPSSRPCIAHRLAQPVFLGRRLCNKHCMIPTILRGLCSSPEKTS